MMVPVMGTRALFGQYRGCIALLSQKYCGVACARNTGLRQDTGEFTLFVHSDDYLGQDSVERLLQKQQKSHADKVPAEFSRHPEADVILFHFYSSSQERKEDCIPSWKRAAGIMRSATEPIALRFELHAPERRTLLFPFCLASAPNMGLGKMSFLA